MSHQSSPFPVALPAALGLLVGLLIGFLTASAPRLGAEARSGDLDAIFIERTPLRATWAVVTGVGLLVAPERVYVATAAGLRATTLRPVAVYVYPDLATLIDVELDDTIDLERGLVVFLPSGRRLVLPVDDGGPQ